MEKYNWIRAFYPIHDGDDERDVFVRQMFGGSEYFIDNDGRKFHVSELDLTHDTFEPQIIPVEKTDGLKWLLESTDAHSILDHKAKIDEREYWRKLRGDIALEIIRKRGDAGYYKTPCNYMRIAEMTEVLFDKLYDQDKEFFKNK